MAEPQVVHGESIGGLQVRGSTLFDGYLNLPDKTAESMTSDGWFVAGGAATVGRPLLKRTIGHSPVVFWPGYSYTSSSDRLRSIT